MPEESSNPDEPASALDSAPKPNLALSSVGNLCFSLAGHPFTIIASLFVANHLGPDEKGLAALTRVLPSFAAGVSGLGIAASLKYEISRKNKTLGQVGATSLVLSLAQGLIAGLVAFLLISTGWLGKLAYAFPMWLQISIALLVPALLFQQTLKMGFAGNMDFRWTNILNFLAGVLFACLSVLFVVFFKWGFVGVFFAFLIGTGVTTIGGTVVFFQKYKPTIHLDREFVKFSYHYGFRAWIGTLAQRGNVSLDQLFLGILAPAKALGNYSVAVSLARLLYMVPQAVAPVFMNQVAESRGKISADKIALIHRALVLVVVVSGAATALMVSIAIPLLLPDFLDVPILILLLLPGAIFFSSFKILGSFFVGSGMPEKSSYCQFIALIGSVISYPILVPLFGGYGAAMASSAVYFLMYLLIVRLFYKHVAPERPELFDFRKSDVRWILSHVSNVANSLKRKLIGKKA